MDEKDLKRENNMLLLEDQRKIKSLEDFNRKYQELEEYRRIMGIKEFVHKKKLWMSQNCKYYMRNNKDQGYSQIDWKGLTLSKHRR